MSVNAAVNAVKQFRLRELSALGCAATQSTSSTSKATSVVALRNPFVPHKNAESGRWAPAKYSLRQQAKIVKQAKAAGNLHLLPPGPKYDPSPLTTSRVGIVKKTDTETTSDVKWKVTEEAERSQATHDAVQTMCSSESDAENRATAEMIKSLTSLSLNSSKADGTSPAKSSNRLPIAKWDEPINWVGNVHRRYVPGADIGARLYAGKKFMFKGHRWERERPQREMRTKMLMRDMPKRIDRFRKWHARGKPKPLRPAKASAKQQKLPF